MANEYTPEEIQQLLDQYHYRLAQGLPITKEFAEQLADASKGVKGYTFALNQSLKGLGNQVTALGSDMLRGVNGASAFNGAIGATTEVVDVIASKFGVLGTVIGGVIKAGGMYVQAVNKQSDALYKSFQDLSKTGTIGAGGMAEAFSSMQKFGYSVEQLGDMTALLAENSKALAAFSGTAFQGSRQFAEVANVMQRGDLGEKFRNMGLGVDDINKNIAGYIKKEVMLGQSRAQMERNLASETGKYIEQIVAVQKLTGQTREQLEEKEQQAQREEAFAYQQYELKKRANAGDEQARKEYERNRVLSQVLEGKTRDQFIAGVGGDISAMGDLMRTAPETVEKILNGGDLGSVMNSLAKEGKQAVDNLGPLAKFHAFNDFLLPIDELLKMQSQYGTESFKELLESAKRNSKTTNEATQDQTKMLMSQMNTRQALEGMINNGIEPVTWAMRKLAEVVDGIVGMLPNFGQKGYGRGGTGSLGGSLAATTAGAASGAAVGAIAGPVGAAVGGVAGGIAGFLGFEGFGGAGGGSGITGGINPSDVLQFGGESGSESAFNGLDREVQGRIIAAGQQYMQTTGRKLVINSAKRSKEDQQRLWDSTGGTGVQKNGMPVAAPGTSSHESGRAVDIEQGKNDRDAIFALNQQGLYQTVPRDPVHFQMRKGDISAAFGWEGTLSGPMSGYRPNLLMHGDEQISIKPSSTAGSAINSSGFNNNEMVTKLIQQVDDLIYLNRSQLSATEKMLKYQQ
jgi:hypothetical protein